jgi:predicted secreted protein
VSIVVGPAIISVSPAQLSRAVHTPQTLTIAGANLTGTDAVTVNPSQGITVGAPSVSSDGSTVTVGITLTSATPTGFVNIVLSGPFGSTVVSTATRFEVVP